MRLHPDEAKFTNIQIKVHVAIIRNITLIVNQQGQYIRHTVLGINDLRLGDYLM